MIAFDILRPKIMLYITTIIVNEMYTSIFIGSWELLLIGTPPINYLTIVLMVILEGAN